jgi:hypothetical protein
VEAVDGGYAENSGTGQLVELWQGIGPLLTAYESRRDADHRAVQPVLVEVDNGTSGGAASCATGDRAAGGPTSTTEAAAPDPPAGDRSIEGGEPLRPLVAQAGVVAHGGAADRSSRCELERVLRADDVAIHRFALYQHPGRRLPLGWSLSSDVLDDLDAVYCLDHNQREAAAVRRLLGEDAPDPAGCRGLP